MSSTAHGRRFRLPVALMGRLEAAAAANARTVEAEMELVLAKHIEEWEARQRLGRGTTAIADHARNTAEGRRLQAEEAAREAAAVLRRRRIANVRRLTGWAKWVEITDPEETRGVIRDPASGETWRPYRGQVFQPGQADVIDPRVQCGFYVRDDELFVLEPVSPTPVPA